MGIKRGRTVVRVYKHAVTAVGVIRLVIVDVPFTKPGVLSWVDLNAEINNKGKSPQKNKLAFKLSPCFNCNVFLFG